MNGTLIFDEPHKAGVVICTFLGRPREADSNIHGKLINPLPGKAIIVDEGDGFNESLPFIVRRCCRRRDSWPTVTK